VRDYKPFSVHRYQNRFWVWTA